MRGPLTGILFDGHSFLGLSVRLKEISGGLDGPIDVLDGVFSREEEGFELAARHIDPSFDQTPEVLSKQGAI